MFWRHPLYIALLAVISASAALVYGQIRTRLDLVVVPVSVRDNNGNLLTGLVQDDFVVLEDGKPQTISNFSADRLPLSAAIIVDDAIRTLMLKRVADQFHSLLSGFDPADELMLFRYDHFVSKLSDFTSDPSVVERSFSDVTRILDARPEDTELDPVLDTR